MWDQTESPSRFQTGGDIRNPRPPFGGEIGRSRASDRTETHASGISIYYYNRQVIHFSVRRLEPISFAASLTLSDIIIYPVKPDDTPLLLSPPLTQWGVGYNGVRSALRPDDRLIHLCCGPKTVILEKTPNSTKSSEAGINELSSWSKHRRSYA